jgi:diguanylate cyclase (GGDEF)-like protein
MRIVLVESSVEHSIAPLLREWGFELVAAGELPEASPEEAAQDPLLFVFNHPDVSEVPKSIHECAKLAAGRPYRTLCLVDRAKPNAVAIAAAAGANDVVSWPGEAAELRFRVLSGKQMLEYERKAHYDYLSGLLNHGAIRDLLHRELQRSRRANAPVAVAMCDIDLFKQVNDTFGHQAGDAAIRAVANRLSSQVRPYDYVGRYGGDEFIVVLINCNPSQAMDICERMRHSVSAETVETTQGPVKISLSLGVVVLDPIRETDVARIVHFADIALYEAKRSGRNRVILASQMP